MFGNPFTGLSECFLSFSWNLILTLYSHTSCLSICHTKHVISLDSPVETSVIWNRISKLLYLLFNWCLWIYTIESLCCAINVLRGWWCFRPAKESIVSILFSSVSNLFICCSAWDISTIESMLLAGWNWLLVNIFSSFNSNNLCSCFMQVKYLSVINEFLFHCGLEFHICILVNTLCEAIIWWSKSSFTICLSV